MKSVFLRGQKRLLIKTVKDAVINNPITIKKIITCIKLMAHLSKYGINPEVNMRIMLRKYAPPEHVNCKCIIEDKT